MKRKYMMALASLALCGSMSAQDIYKVEAFSGSDLNGTARYVGMGGAMNALGADLSAMGTNPAAIGMFRRSDAAFTGSATVQPNGREFGDINKARGSFDQAGFVYSAKLGNSGVKYFNMGFNYQKRRNFKNFIGLDNVALDNGLSQSWQMRDLARTNGGWLDLNPDYGGDDYKRTTPLTVVGYDSQLITEETDDEGRLTGYTPSFANRYNYARAQWGGIQQYDFNVSLNWNDQVYGGLTIGAYNVNMYTRTDYAEELVDGSGATDVYRMSNAESVTGTGFDFKLGVIFRPIEDSPFRIGLAVSSPLFLNLTQNSYLYMNTPYGYTDSNGQSFDRTEADVEIGDYDYNIYTPWRFNLSMATTVSDFLALDAEYEVSRYQGAQVRYPDGDYYYYDDVWSSSKDRELGKEIDTHLQAVHTFRVGAELKVAKGVYLRAGYNYVSAPMKDEAYLNLFTDSPSYAYSTNTDYVNLGEIHRATAGLGVRGKHFYADFAYQYQRQQGTAFAFDGGSDPSTGNFQYLQGQKVDLNRHNAMLTIGYKF